MLYSLTQLLGCSLAAALVFFALGWVAGRRFKGGAVSESVILERERNSWQASLDIVKLRLVAETSRKTALEIALADTSRALTDKTAALEQSDAKVKQLQARIAEVAPLSPVEEPDDLKKIRGIGPKLEKQLNYLGIKSFRDIAQWSDHDIRRFEGQLKEFKNRIQRDKWVENAREEHFKKYGEQLGQSSQAASASSF